jgi:hypothetical protein
MGRLEREIQDHPVKVAKSAFGPYVGWFVVVLVYGWPFAVFHGTARLAVGIPWLVMTIIITVAMLASKNKTPQTTTSKIQQKFNNAKREAAAQRSSSSTSAAARNASRPPTADELRKLADLRDSGVLTEAEFMKLKNRLLG